MMPGSTFAKSTANNYSSLVPMSLRQQLKLIKQLDIIQDGERGDTGELGVVRSASKICNGRGETPLHVAAIKGDREAVIKLLEKGADPNRPDFAGWTPLHEACNHGWHDVALALIQAGASVNARGFDDVTPLHDAAINGHTQLVRLLVEKGADIHSRNRGGKTPGDVAASGLISHLLKPFSDVEKNLKVKFKLNQIKKAEEDCKFYLSINMEEKNGKEDIYEFKSSKEATPVRGNSTSPEVDKNSTESKNEKIGDAYSGSEMESPSVKRALTEAADNDEVDDDVKKKKRKEGDVKDSGSSVKIAGSSGRAANVRGLGSNSEKLGKAGSHILNKNSSATTKTVLAGTNIGVSSDRKSPGSPKGSASSSNANTSPYNSGKTEAEQEEKSIDGDKVDQGPKVPPLKIVIPQQTASEPEQGNRNGKNNTLRHHQALPYVVSSNNNDSEKEGARSRSVSPTDPFKADDKKDPAIGMLSAEDQKGSLHHQRVLRSAHRSGPGANGESRAPESIVPRSNNGNGSNSGTVVSGNGVAGNCGNINSATTSTEDAASQAQTRSPPLPLIDSSLSASAAPVSSSSEASSSSQVSSNYRSNSTTVSKTNTGSTSSTSTTTSDDKVVENTAESTQASLQTTTSTPTPVELHPRKRKLKHNKELKEAALPQVTTERCESATASTGVHPHEQPVKNCYQLFLDIRKQIERRRKSLFPVQPKPPQGFKDYLMNRCTYVLAGNASNRQISSAPLPQNISSPMKDLFTEQEKERHRLRLQHVIEKEKLVLSVEQEILRVHGRAARALANQSLPFSACTILKDEEVYNFITPEQEEKDRNARSRYNGRLFLSWLQDVDDKWEKIKEAMLLRHHNEAESLHAVQKMDWEWKMKELGTCEFKSKPVILESHVPMVHVSDDFDLLPA